MTCTVSEAPTVGFVEKVKVAAVYVECQGEYLFLRRAAKSLFEGQWCVPGGKVEMGESIILGAQRELVEESGIQVATEALTHIKTLYMTNQCASFGFYMH